MAINPAFVNKKRTICEVLREIHRAVDEIRSLGDAVTDQKGEAVQKLVSEAYDMAKRMDLKLRDYADQEADRLKRQESR